MITSMIEEKENTGSRAPRVSHIREILKRSELTEEDRKKIAALLGELAEIEDAYEETQAKKAFIDQAQGKKYYERAREVVRAIKPSAGYTAEIDFDERGILVNVSKIEVRHTGTQMRHVTPVAIIERIILNNLQTRSSIKTIISSLAAQIELFIKDQPQSTDIQEIIDYFKIHSDAIHLRIFLKIVMHFYNKNLFLAFEDSCVKINHHVYDGFLVPTLVAGGTLYVHKSEGSFMSALIKILDYYEEKLQDAMQEKDTTHGKEIVYGEDLDLATIKKLVIPFLRCLISYHFQIMLSILLLYPIFISIVIKASYLNDCIS